MKDLFTGRESKYVFNKNSKSVIVSEVNELESKVQFFVSSMMNKLKDFRESVQGDSYFSCDPLKSTTEWLEMNLRGMWKSVESLKQHVQPLVKENVASR